LSSAVQEELRQVSGSADIGCALDERSRVALDFAPAFQYAADDNFWLLSIAARRHRVMG
jgi:hypothetical protein